MLEFLLKRKGEIRGEIKEITELAGKEERLLTEDQEAKINDLRAEYDKVKRQIEIAKAEEADEPEQKKATPVKSASAIALSQAKEVGEPARKSFETLEEFVTCAIFKQDDPRLADHYQEINATDQEFKTGATGGFMVPGEFREQMLSVDTKPGFVRAHGAQVLERGARPDAEVTLPALDQRQDASGNHQVYGGVTVVHTEEGETLTDTNANLRQVSWKPKEISAMVTLTDKLIRNWSSGQSMITRLLGEAMKAQEDYDFFRGNGVGESQGFIDHAGTYAVNRAGSNAIAIADLQGMYERFMGDESRAVWACSSSAFAQILALTGQGGGATNIIDPGGSGRQPTLYGYPLKKPGRGVRTLGSKGDLCLCDFGEYVIKDGSGPIIAASSHVKFTSNKTVVKIVWNVDGSPWLTEPFQNEEDFDVSPFVVLDVPA